MLKDTFANNFLLSSHPIPHVLAPSYDVSIFCDATIAAALDLEWRVIWVGSAEDSTQDQVLEEVLVGPVSVGVNRFELETPPPDASKIPSEDLKGVTVMLITCSYREREFVRVGYYVSCEMPGDNQVGPNGEQLPGLTPDPYQMVRNILADKPRITKVCVICFASPSSSSTVLS